MLFYHAVALLVLSAGCRHASGKVSSQKAIVESHPSADNDLAKDWEIDNRNVNIWWADSANVYAVTCYATEPNQAVSEQYFSTVDDCKAKFGNTRRTMSIDVFKSKAEELIRLEKRLDNSFNLRRTIDRHKGTKVEDLSDNSEIEALGKALQQEARGNVTSTGDIALFLNELVGLLQRDSASSLSEAKDPETSKGADKQIRNFILASTVGRMIPDAALSKGYAAECKTRMTLASRDIPDHWKRGGFYREELDFTYLLVSPEDNCATYGFERAEFYDVINDEVARDLVLASAENTIIPEFKNPNKVFGGGKLLNVIDNNKDVVAAYRFYAHASGRGEGRFGGEKFETLPSRFKSTNRLCRRQEIQVTKWNPCL